ncbi:MAG TPA: hypothetical protein VM283_05440 [Armatimonadota bacterium]|nr:hypothetical protein [Armatimonadota bacterium]
MLSSPRCPRPPFPQREADPRPMAELIIIEKWAENLDQATINAWLV